MSTKESSSNVQSMCCDTMAQASADPSEQEKVNGAREFVAPLSNNPLFVSHSELVSEQKTNPTLKKLFQSVLSTEEFKKSSTQILYSKRGIVVQMGATWGKGFAGDLVYQNGAQAKYREKVLHVSECC